MTTAQQQNPFTFFGNPGETFNNMARFWENSAGRWNDFLKCITESEARSDFHRNAASVGWGLFDIAASAATDAITLYSNGKDSEASSIRALEKFIRELRSAMDRTASACELPPALSMHRQEILDRWVGLSEKTIEAYEEGLQMSIKSSYAARESARESFSIMFSTLLKGNIALSDRNDDWKRLLEKNEKWLQQMIEESEIREDFPRWIGACTESLTAARQFYGIWMEKFLAEPLQAMHKNFEIIPGAARGSSHDPEPDSAEREAA